MDSTGTNADQVQVPDYSAELQLLILAVQRAAILTQRVFIQTDQGEINKTDRTPVTVGDFGAQALIIAAIKSQFPNDKIMAEETSNQIPQDDKLKKRLWAEVEQTELGDKDADAALGGKIGTEAAMIEFIDAGDFKGPSEGRFWVIDPIDGTLGFTRRRQYAIAAALIDNSSVQVCAIGCPNMPIEDMMNIENAGKLEQSKKGVLFTASRGQGAFKQPLFTHITTDFKSLTPDVRVPLVASLTDQTQGLRIVQGYETNWPKDSIPYEILTKLGMDPSFSLPMDSEGKYGLVASGIDAMMFKVPLTTKNSRKKCPQCTWDHIASFIAEEAGCKATDIYGKKLDFGAGTRMNRELGIVVCPEHTHARVIEVISAVMKEAVETGRETLV